MTTDLRYPIGRYTPPTDFDAVRQQNIGRLARIPASLRLAVCDLTESQLNTPYRPGGWTVRQLVHHVADSHANWYIRLKLALTEDNPTIKPYNENAWSKLADANTMAITVSLAILDSVHERADKVLRSLDRAQFDRTYVHPESGQHTIDYMLGSYSWHGEHHIAHVTRLRAREGW